MDPEVHTELPGLTQDRFSNSWGSCYWETHWSLRHKHLCTLRRGNHPQHRIPGRRESCFILQPYLAAGFVRMPGRRPLPREESGAGPLGSVFLEGEKQYGWYQHSDIHTEPTPWYPARQISRNSFIPKHRTPSTEDVDTNLHPSLGNGLQSVFTYGIWERILRRISWKQGFKGTGPFRSFPFLA